MCLELADGSVGRVLVLVLYNVLVVVCNVLVLVCNMVLVR